MKATVKREYIGQTHADLGVLDAGVVYEVDQLGELFEAVKALKKPKQEEE